MQQVRITIHLFFWFFKFRKPLKRIATLTSRKVIENSPYNKKLLDQQNQEELSEKSREELDETKFNQILFSSTTGEVEETSTSKIEKTTSETNDTQKI